MTGKQQKDTRTNNTTTYNPPMGKGWRNAWAPVWNDTPARPADKPSQSAATSDGTPTEMR